jgi:hypothetical protein
MDNLAVPLLLFSTKSVNLLCLPLYSYVLAQRAIAGPSLIPFTDSHSDAAEEESSEEKELAREAGVGRIGAAGRIRCKEGEGEREDFLMLRGCQGVRATPGGRVSEEAEEV